MSRNKYQKQQEFLQNSGKPVQKNPVSENNSPEIQDKFDEPRDDISTETLMRLMEDVQKISKGVEKISGAASNANVNTEKIYNWTKNDFVRETLKIRDDLIPIKGTVARAEENIRNDIKNSFSVITKKFDTLNGTISNLPTRKFQQDLTESLAGKIVESFGSVAKKQNAYLDERFDDVDASLKGIAESTDVIHSLRNDISEISANLARAKVTPDFPAVNQNEEIIKQLAECGAEILDRLATAARWYARKKPDLDHMSDFENRINEQREEAEKNARVAGIAEGRRQFVSEIIEKFGDVHELFSNENLRILSTILKNEGVETKYAAGDEIEITQENFNSFSGLRPSGYGKIRILTPAYSFGGEIIRDATFEPVEETPAVPAEENSGEKQGG